MVDPQGWLPRPEQEQDVDTFRTVQDAVLMQRRLRIEYRHKARSSARVAVVEPHGLVSAARSWYLCATIDGRIGFTKLSRIDQAEALPEACEGGAVDVSAEWRSQRARFLDGFTAVTATAWVRDTRWSDVHEWVIRVTERDATSPPPDDGDWTFLALEFVDHLHAMTILLRLGPDALVVSPSTLRDDLITYLTATLDRQDGAGREVSQGRQVGSEAGDP